MNDYRSPKRSPLLLWLDGASVSFARLPWWAIIIAAALAMLFYSFATSNLYRRVLRFVTGDPQITTTRFARVGYEVNLPDGTTETVRGTLIAQTDQQVTIELVAEQKLAILLRDTSTITCAAGVGDACAVGSTATIERVAISGKLIFENLGKYQLATDAGDTIDVLKVSVVKDRETRTPDGCRASPEGACAVALSLIPGEQGNAFVDVRIVERTADALVVQTVPPEIREIKRADIARQLDYDPEQCALNNPAACDEGPFLTLQVTLGAFVLAISLGLLFGLMRLSSNVVLFNVATLYVEVIRGVPLLVILLFFNFAFAPWFRDEFPSLAPRVGLFFGAIGALAALYVVWRGVSQKQPLIEVIQPAIAVMIAFAAIILIVNYFGVNSNLSIIQRSILGLGVGYGAFLAELFRAGIQSIGKGQMEAARSLGMNYFQAMRNVILPQAFRVVLPPLGNEFIAILKDTALTAVIALPELTQKARLFAADTYQVFPSYVTIGALYLCMTLFLSFLVRTVERRMAIQSR